MKLRPTRTTAPRSLVARLFVLALGVLAVALALGCKGDQGGASPSASGTASPQGMTVLRLGYFANATHAQAVLAVDTGELAKAIAPIRLETKVFNAGPSLIEALFAGEIDVGYVGPGPAISAHDKSKGRGIRVIAGVASNGVAIVARKDSGIEKMEDLKGKRVATPQLGNTQDISARHYLKTVLGQADLSNVLPVPNAEQSGMFERGQLDAAWAPEPWAQRLIAETGAKLIAEEKDLWPSKEFGLTVIVTTPEHIVAHRAELEKLLAVHRTFTARLAQSPADMVGPLGAALLKLNGKKLPDGVLETALQRVKFTDAIPTETLATYSKWNVDLGFERNAADIASLVDTTFAGGGK